jgi:hypothetical protein
MEDLRVQDCGSNRNNCVFNSSRDETEDLCIEDFDNRKCNNLTKLEKAQKRLMEEGEM